ncbi:MAG TPA: hypothetical protein VFU22_01085 [Roseiflexaceae bacterium]|nr:hypothetical protein [Roseiflexaceae bacterium]
MMSRQNKAGAISALFTGLLVLVVLMASVDIRVSAIARQQSATITPTPCNQEDQEDCDDFGTDTAIAYYATQTAIAEPTAGASTSTVTGTITTGTGTPAVTSTSFASPTIFTTATPLASTAATTPIAPVQQQPPEPSETPTAIPNDTLTCFPGQPLVISGDGPPRSPFLVYFGQRVVSGGSVTSSGRFAATLIIGREHAGVYQIVVRVRGTSQVLLETSCAVPDVTPTFVPRARTLP